LGGVGVQGRRRASWCGRAGLGVGGAAQAIVAMQARVVAGGWGCCGRDGERGS